MAEILDGGDGLFDNPAGSPWYTGAVDYLKGLAKDDAMVLSLLSQPDQTVTRLGFLKLLSAALPADQLSAINSITSLPTPATPTCSASTTRASSPASTSTACSPGPTP